MSFCIRNNTQTKSKFIFSEGLFAISNICKSHVNGEWELGILKLLCGSTFAGLVVTKLLNCIGLLPRTLAHRHLLCLASKLNRWLNMTLVTLVYCDGGCDY